MRARGFSLIELVTVIVVLSIVAAAGAPLLAGSLQVFGAAAPEVDTLSKSRYALERILRELRRTNHNGSGYDLTLSATALDFTRDDGTTVSLAIAPPLLTIAYNGGAAATLTDQLPAGGASFAGFAADGTTATGDPAQIAFVQVDLALERDGAGSNTFSYRTRLLLRGRPS